MKILITEKIAQKGVETILEEGMEVNVKLDITRDELLSIIKDYDALIVRSATKVNKELLEKAHSLKVIGRAGNGVDNINMEEATKNGIIVVNTPDANSVAVAEHTIGLLISSCRNIPQADMSIKSGKWERSKFIGVELLGKTIGIVGLGRIGSLVALRLQSFGMKVLGYDPYISEAQMQKMNVEKIEAINDLMRQSDFITIHMPRTEETSGMIGEEQFKEEKKGIRIVNCARGGIVDEEALEKAIKEGIVAGAGIDVFVKEPNTTSPLLDIDSVVATPHIGASTVEAQYNAGVTIAQDVVRALKGEMVPNAVNLPTLQSQELKELKVYLSLGETLGKLYYQIEKDLIDKIEITYSGEITKYETGAVTLAVLKGIFEPILKETVNYVNAGVIAKERGIAVTESKELEVGNYLNLIKIKIFSHDKTHILGGTVFGKGELRIVEVNGYKFDFTPAPYMLLAEYIDRPGVIGRIGTLLGVCNTNIDTMQVSKNCNGKEALMFLSVDSEVTAETLEIMGKVEGLFRVTQVKL